MNTPAGRRLWGIFVSLILAALIIGGILRWRVGRPAGGRVYGAQKVVLNIASSSPAMSLGEFKNGFASVIGPVLPGVVNISSTKVVKRQNQIPDFFSDPFFRQFFGDQFGPSTRQPQTQREYSLGSGVIVNSNGYILTNNHVVSGASDVEIFTQNRNRFKAHIIGSDPRTDVAVLKIDTSGLAALTIGDSSQLKVGDLVFAIGDPFGIGETATAGIVSAVGRTLGGAIEQYEDFIQTDAPINPGNSGGALTDLHGHLIGINTAIISGQGGGNQGIGFAIPMNMARNVMDQIVAHGKVIRGYLGITIQGVDADMAKAFGLTENSGALVADVMPNSPAAKAGIERGDIVLELNGQQVNSSEDLSLRIAQLAPGSVAHLRIFRNGQTRNVDVTLGEFPDNQEAARGGPAPESGLQGVEVQNLTPDIARQLGLRTSQPGVVVTGVEPLSPAATAGVQTGDLIQEVNRKPIHNVGEYQQAIAAAGNKPVLLLIKRQGITHFVIVQPQ